MNSLYQLIQSLTSAEKKFFRLYSSRYELSHQKLEMILFDIIAKTKDPTDKKIKRKIKSRQLLNQLNLYKHLLYKNLLGHLAHYHLEKSAEDEVIDLLKKSKVLFQKAMYSESVRFLDKAIALARENELFALFLHLCEVRNKYERSRTDAERYFRDNLAGVAEEKQMNEQQRIIIDLRELNNKINYQIMMLGVAEDSRIKKQFSKNILKQLNRFSTLLRSKRAQHLYWKSFISIAYMNQDYKTARHYLQKILNDQEKIPGNHLENREELFRGYYLLLWSYFFQGEYVKAADVFKKINGLKVNTHNLSLLKFDLFINYEILTRIHTGRGDSSEEIERKLLDAYSSYLGLLDLQNTLVIHMNMATLFFVEKKFHKSMEWINKLLAHHQKHRDFEVVTRARILQILIQYELKLLKLLKYSILSTKRFISKKRALTTEEVLLLSAIQRLSVKTDEKRNQLLEKGIAYWVKGKPAGPILAQLISG
ncbi:MAG: hypothetical protein KatS3mg031_1322 [Chitinophagales bacterium]|nr:MAG: hypothetical protein KatS3mg031_1322 [Chitinophagales bacterium]